MQGSFLLMTVRRAGTTATMVSLKSKNNADLAKTGRKILPNGMMIMKKLKNRKNGWADNGEDVLKVI